MSQLQRTQFRMKVLLSLLICQGFTSLFAEFAPKGAAAHSNGKVYIKMPVNMSEALSQGWRKAEVNDYETVLSMPDNPRVGVIFGKDGIVVGMKVAVTVADTTRSNPVSDEQNSMALLFVNPAVIRAGGRGPLNGSVMSELWQRRGRDTAIKASELLDGTGFGITIHCNPVIVTRYYNVTEMRSCRDLKPWFMVMSDTTGEVIGIGFENFRHGNGPTLESHLGVNTTVPEDPDCPKGNGETYRVVAVEVYEHCGSSDDNGEF